MIKDKELDPPINLGTPPTICADVAIGAQWSIRVFDTSGTTQPLEIQVAF